MTGSVRCYCTPLRDTRMASEHKRLWSEFGSVTARMRVGAGHQSALAVQTEEDSFEK